jgi:DNA-binding response OmpR family regulator
VKATLRRAGKTPHSGVIAVNDFTLDVSQREAIRQAWPPVQLTQLGWCCLLEELMLNHGHVLPADSLISHVWGIDGGDLVMLK